MGAHKRQGSNGTDRNSGQENDIPSVLIPTASPETEEALISGSVQGMPEALDALHTLLPDDFTSHVCATVCKAIQDLITSDEMVDIITIGDWLKAHGKITEEINGPALASLSAIIDRLYLPRNFEKWAAIIREKALWRAKASLWRLQADAAARCREVTEEEAAPYQKALERLEAEGSPEFMSVDDLAEEPGIQYLIKGILPEQSLAMCHAAESNLKSFVVDDMLFHIAAGIPWQGHDVKQGKVAFVLNEGGAGFYKRLRGWEKMHRVSLRGKVIVRKPKKRVPLFQLNEPAHVTKLVSSLKTEGAVIVCFDTLSSIIPGVNPNGGDGGMNAAIAHARRIRDEALVTCLFVHHDNKNGEAKGATDFIAAMDLRFKTEAKKDPKGLPTSAIVHCVKPRDDTPFPDLVFSVLVVDVPTEENPYETTLVLWPDGEAAPALPKIKPSEAKSLQCLADGMAAGEWQQAAGVAGVAEQTFWKARKALIDTRLVAQEGERYMLTQEGKNLLSLLSGEQKESRESEANASTSHSLYSPPPLGGRVERVESAQPGGTFSKQEIPIPASDTRSLFNAMPTGNPVDGTSARQPDPATPPAPSIIIDFEEGKQRISGPRLAATPQAIQDESETIPRAATPTLTTIQDAPAQPEQDTPAIKRDYRDWSAAEARAWLLKTAEAHFWQRVKHSNVWYGEGASPADRRQDWTEKIRDAGPMAVQQFAHTWYSRLEQSK